MSDQPRIGVLYPGAMGSALASCAISAGYEVLWCSAGRSAATRKRAADAGMHDCATLAELLAECELLISICPPAAALSLAQAIAERAFRGSYVDANAVAPSQASQIAQTIDSGGASYVDGCVIGPPPHRPGTTRLYLSGKRCEWVMRCFKNSALEVINLGDREFAASGLKMCYAAWSKGSSALLLAVAALAESYGLSDELVGEWQRSIPTLPARLDRERRNTAPKAWRFSGEMEQIAQTFTDRQLPNDFHAGAAAIYEALARCYAVDTNPNLAHLARVLAQTHHGG